MDEPLLLLDRTTSSRTAIDIAVQRELPTGSLAAVELTGLGPQRVDLDVGYTRTEYAEEQSATRRST